MKLHTTRRGFMAATGLFAGALAAPTVLRAQTKYTLKISHYLPPTHGFQTDFIQPWAENLKQKTNGAIDYKIYDVSTAFGRADRQADQVRAGVVDIALGLCGIPRGRFPHSSVIELPFVVERAESGSRALWQLYKENKLGNEYAPFKVLLLMTHNGALIHTVDRPVKQLSDLKGLRIRSPGPAVNAMLEYEGASALALPPSQIYEGLEKGSLDGLATTWDLVAAVRANEVLKYHTDCRLYGAAFYYLMNKNSFARLPKELQTLIDETTGEALLPKVGPWWDKWDAVGKADAVKRNEEIIVIDDAERRKWRDQLKPMTEKYLASLKSEGVDDPAALYKDALDLVQKYGA
ncbi:TRAP transporter substrate-binding protein [Jiella sp. M17.18]|uniref:TRAP transporter substrate-binding protein n=1 Tax=Jiella sp. M17.18 TaxID=3234247 RepID=UPI0034DE6591